MPYGKTCGRTASGCCRQFDTVGNSFVELSEEFRARQAEFNKIDRQQIRKQIKEKTKFRRSRDDMAVDWLIWDC